VDRGDNFLGPISVDLSQNMKKSSCSQIILVNCM